MERQRPTTRTRLPLVYGGADVGPRPETRNQVYEALRRGVEPVVVLQHVARGIDQLWAAFLQTDAGAAERPACQAGCAACCHQRVEATAPEVLGVARSLREAGPDQRWQRVHQTAERVSSLTSQEYFRQRIPCPLLGDSGRCSVYSVRPLACRRVHSLDAQMCDRAWADPALGITIPYSSGLNWNLSSLVIGCYEGMVHAQHWPHQYDLVRALSIALTDPEVEARCAQGDDLFASARTRSATEVADLLRAPTPTGGGSALSCADALRASGVVDACTSVT